MTASARSSRGGYLYYVCKGHTDSLRSQEDRCTARFIPVDQLDELVWQDLCVVLSHPELISYALERARGGYWLPQELQSQKVALEKAHKHLQHQQALLLDAYLADVIHLPEFERKRSELERKEEALTTQISQLQAQASHQSEVNQVTDSVEAFCAQIQPILAQADFLQKRQLVELLIDRVIVTGDHVEIRYVIPTQKEGPHLPFCHLRLDYRAPFW
jgi:site-specific DNA recombinase